MQTEKPQLAKRIAQLPLNVQLEIVKETNNFLAARVSLYEKILAISAASKTP